MKATELKKIRLELNLTQVQMADKIGRSLSMYCYYEHGDYPITKIVERAVNDITREEISKGNKKWKRKKLAGSANG